MNATNTYNKRKGAKFETDLVDYLRSEHSLHAERLPKAGKDDEGDVAVRFGDCVVVIEAKNERTISLSQYVKEALLEANNYAEARKYDEPVWGVAVIKARGKGIGKAYVVMEVDEFANLIKWIPATTKWIPGATG